MNDLGSLYLLLTETTKVFDYPAAILLVSFVILISTVELYIYKESKDKNRLLVVGIFLLLSSVYVVTNTNTLYNSQESIFYSRFKQTEYFTNDVNLDDVSLYVDIESDRVNVVKVGNDYYYISGGNWSILDKDFFENKIAPIPYS